MLGGCKITSNPTLFTLKKPHCSIFSVAVFRFSFTIKVTKLSVIIFTIREKINLQITNLTKKPSIQIQKGLTMAALLKAKYINTR